MLFALWWNSKLRNDINDMNDIRGLDEEDIVPWTENDIGCVPKLSKQQALCGYSEVSITDLLDGNITLAKDRYYFLIVRGASDIVRFFPDRKNRSGHSSMLSNNEWTQECMNTDVTKAKVLYGGFFWYDDTITRWDNDSGHFKPDDVMYDRVGFPTNLFVPSQK